MSRYVTCDERGVWDQSTGDSKTAEVTLNYQQEDANDDVQLSPVDQDPQTELTGRPQRQRQMPIHLQDYVTTLDDVPFDENIINFTLFVDCDLVVYKEATTDDHWVKTIEEEINTIEKHDAQELTFLLIGKKSHWSEVSVQEKNLNPMEKLIDTRQDQW